MVESDTRKMIEEWVDAWNSKDMDRMRSLYAEDAILYQAPVKQTLTGWNYINDRLKDLAEGFPDAKIEISALHIDGDTAILEFNETGTHKGRFLDYEPTGNKIDIDSCLVFKIRDGKVINYTTYLDTVTILRALGLVSVPSTRPEAA